MSSPGPEQPDRFMLWVDSVGGYLVCLDSAVTLGQPTGDRPVAIGILGDVSSRHARIRRDGEDYLLEAIREVDVDGRVVHGATLLHHGATVRLGRQVRFTFRRPHPLSATARLDFDVVNRTQPSADGVLLLADTCVLGPQGTSHVVCRNWAQEVLLFRQDVELFCRTGGPLEVDGRPCKGRAPLARRSRVSGPGFAFSLEQLGE